MHGRTNPRSRRTALQILAVSAALAGLVGLWTSMAPDPREPLSQDLGAGGSVEVVTPSGLQGLRRAGAAASAHQGAPGSEGAACRPPERWLAVRVIDAAGVAVPSARVTVQMQAIRIPVDGDGRARLGPLGPESAWAWARAGGYVEASFEVPSVEEDPGPLAREIVLQRAHDIAGRVVWRDGTPAAHVDVEASVWGHASTDEEGRFSLSGFPPGEHEIRAGHCRGLGGVSGVQALVAAGDEDVEIRLLEMPPPKPTGAANPRSLRVRVTDTAGIPVPSAELLYAGASGRGSIHVISGVAVLPTSDVDTVRVHSARGDAGDLLPLAPATWRREGAFAGPVLDICLPPGQTISGTVRDLEGKPVPDVRVLARRPAPAFHSESGRFLGAPTDASGAFEIPGLPAFPFEIVLGDTAGWRQVGAVEATAPKAGIVLVLERRPATHCEITVLDETGRPVPSALVTIRSFGSETADGRTDVDGRVVLTLWEPDRASELTVHPPTDGGGHALVPIRMSPWQVRDQVIRLRRGRRVAGVVLDLTGRPVPHADVERVDPDGRWVHAAGADGDGKFSLGLLEPGPVSLRAGIGNARSGLALFAGARESVARHRGRVRVVVPGTADIVLEVDPGVPLRLEFAGWPRQSATLSVALVDEEAEASQVALGGYDFVLISFAAVDARGRATFTHLDREKRYRLWLGPVDGGRYALLHGIQGSETQQTVSLPHGLRTVIHVAGATPPRSLHMSARIGPFTVGAERVADDRFVFSGLPPGTWPIRATSIPVNAGPLVSGSALVRAGRSVTLHLEESDATLAVPFKTGSRQGEDPGEGEHPR